MSDVVAPAFAGPWPDGIACSRVELDRYLDDVADGSLDALATRCAPWTGRDITTHLTETYRRFARMVAQSRSGDFTSPFTPAELDDENLRAVADFRGEPAPDLRTAAEGFLALVVDPLEPVAHQLGTLPVGLQVLFGLLDLAVHHDDVLAAAGRSYTPAPATLEALVVVAGRLFGLPTDLPDPWPLMLAGSGRLPV